MATLYRLSDFHKSFVDTIMETPCDHPCVACIEEGLQEA